MRKAGVEGSFWPDDIQEALLRAGVLAPERALAAWAEVRPRLDLDRLRDAESLRLLPLVGRNLVAAGSDDPMLPRLKGVHRHWWYTNQMVLHRVVPSLRALSQSNIDVMALKGVPLGLRYYRDLGMRPMLDVDVLVRHTQIEAAFDVLAGLGWRLKYPDHLERTLRVHHSANLLHHDGGQLDLHWISSPLFRVRGDTEATDDAIWCQSEVLEIDDLVVRMPSAADLVLHVIAHGCWVSSNANVRWAADAATVIAGIGADFDWERVVEQARARHLVLGVRDAFTYLRAVLDVPVPDAVLDELHAETISPRERRVHRALTGDTSVPAILGALPRVRAAWLYRSAGSSRWRAARELPDFLRETWGLRRTSDVPLEAVRKAIRKLRGGASGTTADSGGLGADG